MHNHAPDNYNCPICLAIEGTFNEDTWIKETDIFYRDELVMGFISSKAIKGNEGHPLVVPRNHFENIYDLPDNIAQRVIEVTKKVAIALKETRKADGINVVQNNEPAAGQHAFHFHLHIIPRFHNDNFEVEFWNAKKSEPKERVDYASELQKWFANQSA